MKYYIIIGLSLSVCLLYANVKLHHTENGFKNMEVAERDWTMKNSLKMITKLPKFLTNKPNGQIPEILPNDGQYLRTNNRDFSVTFIGHSTVLVQYNGINFLTDPIWSERCSPISFAGPKRFTPPGVSLENLPDIDFILSSHNHYDHLDKSTVKYFINKNCLFIVPLKVKPLLVEWGSKNVVELDWWDSTSLRNVTIVSTPAQHFSNRSTNDRNKTLWATYLVDIDGKKIYFGGDTGYFSGFKDIGRRFGRIDLAMIPIGAYNDEMSGWRDIHLNPEDAVTAYKDLNAEYFIPIHWGTFQLAFHPIDEPVTRLKNRISDDKLDNEKFLILKIGETRILK